MPTLLYQGHGSFRLTSSDGVVVYIDPFMGTGYDLPADVILVTHQHDDHNQVNLITQKPNCSVITNVEALEGEKHNSFSVRGIDIEAVEAGYNEGHSANECVGYILTVDAQKLYFCGDTSKTPQMAKLAAKKLDYAFLCADGFYNMNLEEAAECAVLIGATHNVPVHLKPGKLFDREMAEQFKGPNRLILEAGQEVVLG